MLDVILFLMSVSGMTCVLLTLFASRDLRIFMSAEDHAMKIINVDLEKFVSNIIALK
jgi:hypothetical protein